LLEFDFDTARSFDAKEGRKIKGINFFSSLYEFKQDVTVAKR
jgi:hypothetical protein